MPSTLTVTNVLSWTGGYMQGSGITNISPAAVMNMSGSTTNYLDGRTVYNYGTANWTSTSTNLYMSNGALFNNMANAVFNACGVRVRELPITPDKILMGLMSERRSA